MLTVQQTIGEGNYVIRGGTSHVCYAEFIASKVPTLANVVEGWA
jgi:hypothetical protein